MDATALRSSLRELLAGRSAHVDLDSAVAGLPADLRGRAPEGFPHSIWQLLEHMRIAQRDIVRWAVDADWRSPPWPEGYWPEPLDPVDDATWNATLDGWRQDRAELLRWLDEDGDGSGGAGFEPTAAIPFDEQGRPYLRQMWLAATHDSYHLGQVVTLRRVLGAWPPDER